MLTEDLGRDVNLDSMNGDGVCDVTEEMNIKLIGLLEINLPEDMEPVDVRAHSTYIGHETNPMEIELDLGGAEILGPIEKT